MIIPVNKQWDKKGLLKGGSNDTKSVMQRSEFFRHMNPWTNRSNHEETNCTWCRMQNHGAAIGKARRTWWYCVDQGKDLGFTVSAVV